MPLSTLASNTVSHSRRRNHLVHLSHTTHLVIVAGHTRCGGCAAAWSNRAKSSTNPPDVPLVRWLAPLVKLAQELDLADQLQEEAVDALVSRMSPTGLVGSH
jgi:carbonic anhydrase